MTSPTLVQAVREMLNMKIYVDTDDDVRLARRWDSGGASWRLSAPQLRPSRLLSLLRVAAHILQPGPVPYAAEACWLCRPSTSAHWPARMQDPARCVGARQGCDGRD